MRLVRILTDETSNIGDYLAKSNKISVIPFDVINKFAKGLAEDFGLREVKAGDDINFYLDPEFLRKIGQKEICR